MEKKRSVGVTVFGWLLIVYCLCVFCLPIMMGIIAVVKVVKEGISERPPISDGFLVLKYFLKLPSILLVLISISSVTQGVFVPVSGFIGGIAALKLKKWASKFLVSVFCINIVAKFIYVLIVLLATLKALSESHMGVLFSFKNFIVEHFHIWKITSFLIFDILIIYFFTRPKVKEQFK